MSINQTDPGVQNDNNNLQEPSPRIFPSFQLEKKSAQKSGKTVITFLISSIVFVVLGVMVLEVVSGAIGKSSSRKSGAKTKTKKTTHTEQKYTEESRAIQSSYLEEDVYDTMYLDNSAADTYETESYTEPEYVMNTVYSASQISESQMQNLQALALHDFQNDIASVTVAKFTQFNYVGNIVMVSDDVEDPNTPDSVVYLFFQIQLLDKEGSKTVAEEYYWCEGFSQVFSDGSIDEQRRFVPQDGVESDAGWTAHGTISVENARQSALNAVYGYYEVECNIDYSLILPLPEVNEMGFVFPYSDVELIPESEIAALSDEDLRKAINEIWARHGYIFRKQEILDYYRQFDWYEEKVPADEWDSNGAKAYLNSTELANQDNLVAERQKRGGNGA